MKTVISIFAVLLMVGGATAFAGDLKTESEIVILDPPPALAKYLKKRGYLIIQEIKLEELEMTALKISLPKNLSLSVARTRLEAKFPDIELGDVADLDDFTTAAGK